MPTVVIIGFPKGLRRRLEKAHPSLDLRFIYLAVRQGRLALAPLPNVAVAHLDSWPDPQDSKYLVLPYAPLGEVHDYISTCEELEFDVVRIRSNEGDWPARPPRMDQQFLDSLYAATDAHLRERFPPDISNVHDAIAFAKAHLDTLVISPDLHIDTSEPGIFWYGVLNALHELCGRERQGLATRRETLRDLLSKHVGVPGDLKTANTGLSGVDPESGESIEVRQRVHLREGKPADTESIYWCDIGKEQSLRRFLIVRIGRHV